MRAIMVGGGIAGLASALALSRRGWQAATAQGGACLAQRARRSGDGGDHHRLSASARSRRSASDHLGQLPAVITAGFEAFYCESD
jgi:glycine/D-amino acid oxidase-like deaminating enzyme